MNNSIWVRSQFNHMHFTSIDIRSIHLDAAYAFRKNTEEWPMREAVQNQNSLSQSVELNLSFFLGLFIIA